MSHTVGLVADNPAAMVQLRSLIQELDQTVTYALTAEQVLASSPLHPSLWIVISEQAAEVYDILNEWSEAPIFLADDLPPENEKIYYEQWRTSLCDKICRTLEVPDFGEGPIVKEVFKVYKSFEEVWVLAASLGGPEAVRVFLENINPNLPIAFVYAQHIEPTFDRMLPSVIGKGSKFAVNFCTGGEILETGSVVVLPSHCMAKIDEKGRLKVYETEEWDAPYTPNIGQVIENVSEFYQDKMGVIVFSGMCDDGAEAAVMLKDQGVPLWAQDPEDCICSAMPEAVINQNAVNYIGTAENLAKHLNNRFGKY